MKNKNIIFNNYKINIWNIVSQGKHLWKLIVFFGVFGFSHLFLSYFHKSKIFTTLNAVWNKKNIQNNSNQRKIQHSQFLINLFTIISLSRSFNYSKLFQSQIALGFIWKIHNFNFPVSALFWWFKKFLNELPFSQKPVKFRITKNYFLWLIILFHNTWKSEDTCENPII